MSQVTESLTPVKTYEEWNALGYRVKPGSKIKRYMQPLAFVQENGQIMHTLKALYGFNSFQVYDPKVARVSDPFGELLRRLPRSSEHRGYEASEAEI